MRDFPGSRSSVFTYDAIRSAITDMLPAPVDFGDDDHLIGVGLDSMKVMRLVNRWRREGAKATFAELIKAPTLTAWLTLLQKGDRQKQKKASQPASPAPSALFPLTDVQYAYWMGRRDDQPLGGRGCHAYLEIDGRDVDPERLEKAWTRLLFRHPMLRTVFHDSGMQETRAIPAVLPRLSIHDLRALNPKDRDAALLHTRERLSHRRLAVELGQTAGIELSLLPEGRTRLHIDIDLLVADVQSLSIVLHDLAVLYGGGELPPLPENWSFADLLHRESLRKEEERQHAAKYWEERLPVLPGPPVLPLKTDPESVRFPIFSRRTHRIPLEQWRRLKERAAARKVTPAMTLLALYAEVLDRWSATSRFFINVPLFDRPTDEPGIEHIVSDFTNLLLLAVDCADKKTFQERALDVQACFHEDVAHSAWSGVQVQRDLARFRRDGRVAAPVVFACNLDTPLMSKACRKAFGEQSYMISQTPQVWLDFQVYEEEDGLLLAWDAVDELFPEGMVDAMLAAYGAALERLAVDAPTWDSPVSLLDDTSLRETRNHVPNAIPLDSRLLHEGFFAHAARLPSRTALIVGDTGEEISYGALAEKSLRLAAALAKDGARPGEAIAVTLPRGPEQVAAVLGILACGACYVPVGPAQPRERRERIHRSAGICRVITDRDLADRLAWPAGSRLISCDAVADAPAKAPAPARPEGLAYIIFTSGSTGEPKGVETSHEAAWNTIAALNRRYAVDAEDRVLAVSSLDFDLSVYDIFGLLSAGGSLVLVSDRIHRDAVAWNALIRRHAVTIWNSVPLLLDMLLTAGDGAALPLRAAMLSGDRIGLDLPARLQAVADGCRFIAMGGATEAAIWSNINDVAVPIPSSWTSIPYGRPLDNQAYRVVDAKGRDCPDWVEGELWIGGAGVAKGYRGKPELTNERFVRAHGGRWYRTGDLGRYLPGGIIEFMGRQDFQIKIRGHRIEPGEIEAALKQYPGIREAVVAAFSTVKGEKRLAAYIVREASANEGGGDFLARLSAFLREKLPEYMVPAHILELERLPLSDNGKLDRKKLPVPAAEQNEDRTAPAEAASPLELALASVWSEVLGTRVGLHDDFFELGGDSLLATRLIAGIRGALSVELPLDKLFGSPTVAGLARYMEQAGSGSEHTPTVQTALPAVTPDPAGRHAPFPLTDVQHAYWIGRLGAYDLGGVASHIYFEFDNDRFDLSRLNAAWQVLVKRHDMLRAVFLRDGTQRVLPDVPPCVFPVDDLTDRSPKKAESAILALREKLSRQALPTDTWPLFDIRALRHTDEQGNARTRLFLDFDALIADAWSLFLLVEEWLALYNNPDAELPALTLGFRDYVLAEAELRRTEAYQRDRQYWLERIPNLPPPAALPLVRSPGDIKEPRTVRRGAILEEAAWKGLKSAIAEAGLTPSGLLIAAYAEVLAKWSASPHFCLNLTLFNRLPMHPEVNDVVGDFTSLVLLEVDNTRPAPFVERARDIQRQLWRDIGHRLFGGVEVLREMNLRKSESGRIGMPIVFTGAVSLAAAGRDSSALGRMGRLVTSITQTPQVMLDHQAYEQDGALVLNWDAAEDLFPSGLLDAMFAAYVALLRSLAGGETAWNTEAPLALPKEQAEVREALEQASQKELPEPLPPLHALFERQARMRPEAPAVITPERTLSYGELRAAAARIAHELQARNIPADTLVAIVMEKGWEQVAAALGILMAGAAYLPIDPDLPKERLLHLLQAGEVTVALTKAGSPGFERPDAVEILPVREALLEPKNAPEPPRVNVSPENLAYVIFTSGSTGTPKGVMIDHRGAVNTLLDINERFGVTPEDRFFALSGLSFDLSVYDIFGALAGGAAIVLPAPDETKNPSHWLTLLQRHAVSVWNSVPALMRVLIDHATNAGLTLPPSLRLALLSGDWIPPALPDAIRAKAPKAQIVGLGGATEASIWSILYPIAEVDPNWKSIPYGSSMRNQRVAVLDGALNPCPDWVEGEIHIGGIGLAVGYWRDAEKTAASFVTHPQTGERLYRTGDKGRHLPDGSIEFLGRKDFQVKINGYRVELGEIEHALGRHPGVRHAVVIAVGDAGKDKRLAAFVVPRENAPTNVAEEARNIVATKLPAYMTPHSVTVLDALPLTLNGKIDRNALIARVPAAASLEKRPIPPGSRLEKALAEIWGEILEQDAFGVHDNFFEQGGNSLLAIRLASRLQTTFRDDIGIVNIFEHPTIHAMAKFLGSDAKEPEGALMAARGKRRREQARKRAAATGSPGMAQA